MSFVDKVIDDIIKREGGYINHPSDKGGATRWGITEAVARQNGWKGNMKDLPISLARDIYKKQYYTASGAERVASVNEKIAEEMLDTAVNMGTGCPAKWLQTSLNCLNEQGKLFPDLVVDGKIGNASVSALQKFLAKRGKDGETVILRCLNCLQGARYISITESRQKNEDFFYGWMLHRIS